MTFRTPIRDMRFILDHAAGFSALEQSGAYPELSGDLVDAILEEMGKFCDGVIAPLNEESDRNGAKLENGVVRTTPGFKEAYAQYVEGGWSSLAFPEEAGGQGLPSTLAVALVDGLNGACMSFAIGTTLTTGAVKAILHAATPEQKTLYLEKMVTGEWTGTMNLTEPQQSRAGWRRDLQNFGAEDFYHLWRSRHDGQCCPSRAGAAAGCARRHRRHFHVPRAEISCEGRRLTRRPQ